MYIIVLQTVIFKLLLIEKVDSAFSVRKFINKCNERDAEARKDMDQLQRCKSPSPHIVSDTRPLSPQWNKKSETTKDIIGSPPPNDQEIRLNSSKIGSTESTSTSPHETRKFKVTYVTSYESSLSSSKLQKSVVESQHHHNYPESKKASISNHSLPFAKLFATTSKNKTAGVDDKKNELLSKKGNTNKLKVSQAIIHFKPKIATVYPSPHQIKDSDKTLTASIVKNWIYERNHDKSVPRSDTLSSSKQHSVVHQKNLPVSKTSDMDNKCSSSQPETSSQTTSILGLEEFKPQKDLHCYTPKEIKTGKKLLASDPTPVLFPNPSVELHIRESLRNLDELQKSKQRVRDLFFSDNLNQKEQSLNVMSIDSKKGNKMSERSENKKICNLKPNPFF